jgi:N,N'-diacetyllegionaminate synthase
MSTGMATLAEIGAALAVLESAGTARERITALHCSTEYPTPMQDVNLRAMLTIRDAFGVQVGYSDHTLGIEVAIAAVALGAAVIEKHVTLDRDLPGPDHQASLEPAELASMVAAIRNIEQALGDGVKQPSTGEARNMAVVRKSLVAAQAISKGEPYTKDNIAVKRPGTGLSPMRLDEVIGRVAPRDFAADELIEL